MKTTVDSKAAGGARGAARVSLLGMGAIALGVFFLAQVSGCASVRTRIQGGPYAHLTAQATGQLQKYIVVWDVRKAPDGSWHWRATTGIGHGYVCSWMKGSPRASCGGDYLDPSMDPLQD